MANFHEEDQHLSNLAPIVIRTGSYGVIKVEYRMRREVLASINYFRELGQTRTIAY